MVVHRSKVDMVRQQMRGLPKHLLTGEWSFDVVPTVGEARLRVADEPSPTCVIVSLDAEDVDLQELSQDVLPILPGLVVFVVPKEHVPKNIVQFLEVARQSGYSRVLAGLPGTRPYTIVDALNEAARGTSVDIVEDDWSAVLSGEIAPDNSFYNRPTGRVIMIASPKGGTGKTTVALNLASRIAMECNAVLWDANFGNPNCTVQLGLNVQVGIEGLADLPRITPDVVRSYLLQSGQLQVLPGPSARFIGKGRVEIRSLTWWTDVLEALREMFDVVIIDTNPDWDDASISTMAKLADRIYVVEDQSKFTEIETMRQVPKLAAVGVKPERIGLIINRYTSGGKRSEKDVLASFNGSFRAGTPARLMPRLIATLGNDWEGYLKAQWSGKAVSTDPKVARQWQPLVEDALPGAGPLGGQPERRGLFGRRR